MKEEGIEISNVKLNYGKGEGVIDNINIKVSGGERVGMVGN